MLSSAYRQPRLSIRFSFTRILRIKIPRTSKPAVNCSRACSCASMSSSLEKASWNVADSSIDSSGTFPGEQYLMWSAVDRRNNRRREAHMLVIFRANATSISVYGRGMNAWGASSGTRLPIYADACMSILVSASPMVGSSRSHCWG